jgi:hypothetical protein
LGGMMQHVGLAVDKAVGGEVLGVDHRRIDVGENLELVRDARVIAVARQAIADAPVAALRFDKGSIMPCVVACSRIQRSERMLMEDC